MARTDNLTNFLTDVASAIRTKGGTSSQIPASDFDTAIANLPGADIDWSAIGYSGTPGLIDRGYVYAKNIYDNWNPAITDMSYKYRLNKDMILFPLVDTSNVTNMNRAFEACTSLIYLPSLNLSKVTNMNMAFSEASGLIEIGDLDISKCENLTYTFQNCYGLNKVGNIRTDKVQEFYYTFSMCNSLRHFSVINMSSAITLDGMFYGCDNLTDESLDNIMQSCITATSYQGTKRLNIMGIYVSESQISSLPHYQDFVNAGWSA